MTVELSPSQQSVAVGQSATLNCSIAGSSPVLSVSWFHNGQPLVSNSHRRLVSREVVHFTKVDREDRGMYKCIVSTEFQSIQATAQLSLRDDAPSFLETFTETTLDPGPSVSLKCVASGSPLPQVTWSLDGYVIPDNIRFRTGDYVTRTGLLVSYVNITSTMAQAMYGHQ
ncbi:Down syndrome cell adhesion molecule-like protein Dscam2 [Halotydeus destructor]|nr:Down syndrome cell adhesion molecule-like protein Dscam2 [Halotydeus destructor]